MAITFEMKNEGYLIQRTMTDPDDCHDMDEVIREFRFFLKGMTFGDDLIDKYVLDPDSVRARGPIAKKK